MAGGILHQNIRDKTTQPTQHNTATDRTLYTKSGRSKGTPYEFYSKNLFFFPHPSFSFPRYQPPNSYHVEIGTFFFCVSSPSISLAVALPLPLPYILYSHHFLTLSHSNPSHFLHRHRHKRPCIVYGLPFISSVLNVFIEKNHERYRN